MKKIESQLMALIDENPKKIYSVVIVCASDRISEDARLSRIMDNIFSSELSGEEINKLVLRDEVLSIELDQTITVE